MQYSHEQKLAAIQLVKLYTSSALCCAALMTPITMSESTQVALYAWHSMLRSDQCAEAVLATQQHSQLDLRATCVCFEALSLQRRRAHAKLID